MAAGTSAADDSQGDPMRRSLSVSVLLGCAVTVVAGCAGTDEAPGGAAADTGSAESGSGESGSGDLTASLVTAAGEEVGQVSFTEVEEGLEVSVEVTGLPPGFHGFHVHAVGQCEPDSVSPSDPSMRGDFFSAGGHIGAGEVDHPEHPGDLPQLYVEESGTGSLTAATDRLTLDQLTDDDGSAVMVHADPDDYANIPTRYAPDGPDEMTLNTGDSGGRVACGVVEG